jgi:methionyl-tRNA synthetase
VWRYYIYFNRPEKSDYNLTWKDIQEKVNSELIGNLANLVNRTLTFIQRFLDGKVPEGSPDKAFWDTVRAKEDLITEKLNRAELKEAFREIFALSAFGNKMFQDGEPWKTRNENPEKTAALLRDLLYLVRDLAVLIHPYMPATSRKISGFLGFESLDWNLIGEAAGELKLSPPEILFEKLEDSRMEELQTRYSGSQAEREEEVSPADTFAETVDLRAALITDIRPHPQADKLYIVQLDTGEEEERIIISGLVGRYTPEQLSGKTIILVFNLKPAKLRGIKSQGMLLAAEDSSGKLEVLMLNDAVPGDRVTIKGRGNLQPPVKKISIDKFFEIPVTVSGRRVTAGGSPLVCGGKAVQTSSVEEGTVG